jgi:hypothetical protein
VRSPEREREREALEDVSPSVFPNLRRTHKYRNLGFCEQLSFYFLPFFSLIS